MNAIPTHPRNFRVGDVVTFPARLAPAVDNAVTLTTVEAWGATGMYTRAGWDVNGKVRTAVLYNGDRYPVRRAA